jgi:hypothetical protein
MERTELTSARGRRRRGCVETIGTTTVGQRSIAEQTAWMSLQRRGTAT